MFRLERVLRRSKREMYLNSIEKKLFVPDLANLANFQKSLRSQDTNNNNTTAIRSTNLNHEDKVLLAINECVTKGPDGVPFSSAR